MTTKPVINDEAAIAMYKKAYEDGLFVYVWDSGQWMQKWNADIYPHAHYLVHWDGGKRTDQNPKFMHKFNRKHGYGGDNKAELYEEPTGRWSDKVYGIASDNFYRLRPEPIVSPRKAKLEADIAEMKERLASMEMEVEGME